MGEEDADALGYAGELTPKEAWALLEAEPEAVLVDIRTQAEWSWVGVPDASSLGREPKYASWVTFPGLRPNPDFLIEMTGIIGHDHDRPVLLICRSGVRSALAAAALTRAGYRRCYNVAQGFEGDKNEHGHRGTIGGWKVAGLPWRQE